MPGFVLQAAPVPADLPRPTAIRVGFTVSRKVGNAVTRNRVAPPAARGRPPWSFPDQARPDLDYVLVGRQAALERDFAVMRQELVEALKRLKARWRRRDAMTLTDRLAPAPGKSPVSGPHDFSPAACAGRSVFTS